ncbi:unnamed protein product [Aphanomyces euteiches]
MLRKLVFAVVTTAAAVLSASPVSTSNASQVNTTNNIIPAVVTPYGRELFGKLLDDLKIEHVPGQPISTIEYNEAVDGVEDIIRGRWKFDKKYDEQVKRAVRNLMARMTPAEMEQLFNDVAFDLITTLFAETFPETNITFNASSSVNASAPRRRAALVAVDSLVIVSAFAACVVAIAMIASVAIRGKKEEKASSLSITAEVILAEIEDAEKMCQVDLAADKDAVTA